METSSVKYLGELRTEAIHLQSGSKIYTDAPKDNHGKGEMFSPTDLTATSLASCMISVGQHQLRFNAQEEEVSILPSQAEQCGDRPP